MQLSLFIQKNIIWNWLENEITHCYQIQKIR